MRIVSTLPLFTAAPLVTTQAFQVRGKQFENQDTVHTEETCDYSDQNIAMNFTLQRFRRDVLEGTLEEMVDMEAVSRANTTEAERVRRQAEFPGNPDQDNTK